MNVDHTTMNSHPQQRNKRLAQRRRYGSKGNKSNKSSKNGSKSSKKSGVATYNTLVVLNSLGQEVRRMENNTKSVVSFDFSGRRGVYFVKMSAIDGSTITKRVIVK